MSRAWLPSRILAGIALTTTLTMAATSSAHAQDPNHEAQAITVVGNDADLRRCSSMFGAGTTTDDVIRSCTRALRYPRLTHDNAVQVNMAIGVIHLRRREGDDAVAAFDAVLALEPRNPEAHLNKGAALVISHQPGPAVTEITQALSLGVAEPEKAYYNRGAAREALGDLRGAYEDYSTALQIRPQWAPADQELARFVRGRREHLATVLGEQQHANP
jgi:tetratricopeptide (TPR) repeat protein